MIEVLFIANFMLQQKSRTVGGPIAEMLMICLITDCFSTPALNSLMHYTEIEKRKFMPYIHTAKYTNTHMYQLVCALLLSVYPACSLV